MCGICGFHGFEDRTLVKKMCKTLYHRGPDDEGFFFDKNVNLGLRRLSIIDTKGGHQPIHNEDESIWIVFNGEIYNYLDLKEKLEKKGHIFYTQSDTEVIVHCYEEFGIESVKKLRGDFAFAIWDSNKKRLILARDRLGVAPLYYTVIDNSIVFASEIKAILEYEKVKRELDFESLHYYLTFGYVPSPLTGFKNIKKLLPGHILIWENENYNISKYWDVESKTTNFSEDYYLKNVTEIIKESVKIRLMGEVPLGVYLSGGLDSSTITAVVSKIFNKPVKTFSVGNDYEPVDELKYARIVSEKFNTDHHEIIVNSEKICKNIFKIFWHVDDLVADSAAIPEFFLSKEAKKKVTIILSGGGSDELFGGYKNYENVIKMETFRRMIPEILKERIPLLANLLTKNETYLDYAAFFSSKDDKALQYKTQGYLFYYDKGRLYSDNLKVLTRSFEPKEIVKKYYFSDIFKNYPKDIFNRLSYVDLKMFVPDNCLFHQERTGYANSVEIRAPFLDHKLVEFAFTIPPKYKIRRGQFKYIIKKAMKNYLPKETLHRKKLGFPAPTNFWFSKGELMDFASSSLDESPVIKKYFDGSYVKYLLSNSELTKNSHKLWGLFVLSIWYKIFFEDFNV